MRAGKIVLITTIPILILFTTAEAGYGSWNPTLSWNLTLSNSTITHIQKTQNGIVIVAYNALDVNPQSSCPYDVAWLNSPKVDSWLIKLDENGKFEWRKNFSGLLHLISVQPSSDGYLILGDKLNETSLRSEPLLIKTDREGNEVWRKVIKVYNESFGWVIPTACSLNKVSDGYLVAGKVIVPYKEGRPVYKIGWLAKFDGEGNVLWSKLIFARVGISPEKNQVFFRSACESDERGYAVVGGVKMKWALRGFDGWMVKTDRNGSEEWSKVFGGKGDDEFYSVKPTPDGYIIAGFTSNSGRDAWLIKIDGEGNEVWNQTFGGKDDDYACCVEVLKDGFVVAGYTVNQSKSYAWLIKTDENGRKLWKLILRSGIATSLVKVKDGFVIAGYDYSDKSAWLVKVREESGLGFGFGSGVGLGIKAGIVGLAVLALILIVFWKRRG